MSGFIHGVVYINDHAPVQDATVSAYDDVNEELLAQDTTGVQGDDTLTIKEFPTGSPRTVWVLASHDGNDSQEQLVTVTNGGTVTVDLQLE